MPLLRIGHGFDVHAFAEQRRLMLGGCDIPHTRGLAGHSDADVLLHALTDALLGALAWGDIGQWFPDTDASFKDIDSALLLARVWEKATAEGWQLNNCDCVIMAQEPKLAPHIVKMRERVAALLEVDPVQIGIKATTTERLGFVGRSEGIAASAVVLLMRSDKREESR